MALRSNLNQTEWGNFAQPDFDRVVELLIHRKETVAGNNPWAVKGRGGDKGLDLHVLESQRSDERPRVYQLKHFPGGFGSNHQARKRLIKESFTTAMQHNPFEWVLVVPENLSIHERKFVLSLKKQPGVPHDLIVKWIGRVELDDLCAQFPDISTYALHKDDRLEVARLSGIHREVGGTGAAGILEREAAFAQNDESLDPFWRMLIREINGEKGFHLEPKRPDAAERSPITITSSLTVPKEDPLNDHLRLAIDYGAPMPDILPARYLEKTMIEGSSYASVIENDTYGLITTRQETPEGLPKECTIAISSGRELKAEIRNRSKGEKGYYLELSLAEHVILKFLLPKSLSGPPLLEFSLNIEDVGPHEILVAAKTLKMLLSASYFSVSFSGEKFFTGQHGNKEHGKPDTDWLDALIEVAEDLIAVQDYTLTPYRFARTPTAEERTILRALAIVIGGGRTFIPGILYLPAESHQGTQFHEIALDEGTVMIAQTPYGWEIMGQDVRIPCLTLFSPQAVIEVLHTDEDGTQYGVAKDKEGKAWTGLIAGNLDEGLTAGELIPLEPKGVTLLPAYQVANHDEIESPTEG